MKNSYIKTKESAFDKKVVFITGLYKCGTTWLSFALGKHPQAAALIELDAIRAFAHEGQAELVGKDVYDRLRYIFSATSYGGLPLEVVQQSVGVEREELFNFFEGQAQKQIILGNSFIDYHFDRMAGSKLSGNGIDIESLLSYWNLDNKSATKIFGESLLEPDPRKAIRNFCKVHQEFSGEFCVFKSADQINHIKHLQEVMPISPKVLIIRDGRDMAISATKFEDYVRRNTHFTDIWQFVETDFWERLRQWKSLASSIHTYKQNGEIYILRYEDLISNFETTITNLLNYLGMCSTIEIVEHMRAETTFEKMSGGRARGQEDINSNIRNGMVGEWKLVLDDTEKKKAWELAGEELSLFGYEK